MKDEIKQLLIRMLSEMPRHELNALLIEVEQLQGQVSPWLPMLSRLPAGKVVKTPSSIGVENEN